MRFLRTIALLALLSTTACYGSFALFHKIHKWNGTLGDKWVNSVLHVALWIVPAYELVVLGDFLLFNTIEFWSGKNPVDEKVTQRELELEQELDEAPEVDAQGVVHLRTPGHHDTLTVVGPELMLLARDGKEVVLAQNRGGGEWGLLDLASGREVQLSARQVQQLTVRD